MKGMLNAHRLFTGNERRNGYLHNLKVADQQEQALRKARDLIRRTLRDKLPLEQPTLKAHGFIDQAFLKEGRDLPLKPKFRMQGSAVYATLNDPAHKPPQEIDYDDGVFLPTSFLVHSNAREPALAAKGYFRAVERVLEPLCEEQGWELVTTKNSCVRIAGVAPNAHIDVPLYAIPDEDFSELTEAAQAEIKKSLAAGMAFDDVSFSEPVFRQLREDHIMLATREKGWLESDPRKIEDWFLEAIKDHGESLRRVCRYLKGWRDYNWHESKLSSLSLMACVVQIYEDFMGAPPKNRDDLTLLLVAEKLSERLSQPIENPVLDQYLDSDWSESERAQFVAGARQLYQKLQQALQQTAHKGLAIQHMREVFGPRIPEAEELLDNESEEARVYTYEPRRVSAPIVPRTTSG